MKILNGVNQYIGILMYTYLCYVRIKYNRRETFYITTEFFACFERHFAQKKKIYIYIKHF